MADDGAIKQFNAQHAPLFHRIKEGTPNAKPPQFRSCCMPERQEEGTAAPIQTNTQDRDEWKKKYHAAMQRRKIIYKRFYEKMRLKGNGDLV